MTQHSQKIAATIDQKKLDRLAEVAVKVGLRLEPGQDLFLTAPVVALPLVRLIAKHAYAAGAGLITPILADEEVTLGAAAEAARKRPRHQSRRPESERYGCDPAAPHGGHLA